MKTILSGYSDDLIELEGAIIEEIGYNKKTKFLFSDGTLGYIEYDDYWNIDVKEKGIMFDKIIRSDEEKGHSDEDALKCASYSDVLVLKTGIEWVYIGKKKIKTKP